MKAMFVSLGAVLVAALAVSTANAQNFGRCVPQAPDCCGPSYYAPNWFGLVLWSELQSVSRLLAIQRPCRHSHLYRRGGGK